MKISMKELASKVADLLGESLALECHPSESPFPSLENRVSVEAPGLLAELISSAPWETLTEPLEFSASPLFIAEETVSLPLPDNFFRLYGIKFSGWEFPLVEALSPADHKALLRQSRWKGIRGNRKHPAAVISFDSSATRCLFIYGVPQNSSLEFAGYIPYPSISSDNMLTIPEPLLQPLLGKLVSALGS